MGEKQTFLEGFIEGWQSIAGDRLQPPEIATPPTSPVGSKFIHGMMEGIEAAKKRLAELH